MKRLLVFISIVLILISMMSCQYDKEAWDSAAQPSDNITDEVPEDEDAPIESDPGLIVAVTDRVIDGDTVIFITPSGEMITVRLYGIDTPERSAPYFNDATDYLKEMIIDQEVYIDQIDTDRYQRIVAKLYVNDIDICAEMVASGWARWYEEYAKDDKGLEALQRQAMEDKLGIWQNYTGPIPDEPSDNTEAGVCPKGGDHVPVLNEASNRWKCDNCGRFVKTPES